MQKRLQLLFAYGIMKKNEEGNNCGFNNSADVGLHGWLFGLRKS